METKKETKAAAAAAPETVKARVVKQPVHEDGRTYFKGAVFELSPERFAALGELIVPASAK